MDQRQIDVAIPGREYAIEIAQGSFAKQSSPALKPFVGGRTCMVLTDSNVGPIYLDNAVAMLRNAGAAEVKSITFPAGEESKTLASVAGFYGDCVRAGLDRKSVVVALGGGVTGDMAGFLAATYMRGIEFVQMPTSLLAQVDSSVGGKTGVDLPEGKNLVGAFKQPLHVLIDIDTLTTLPKRELRSGLAEVVKYGVIFDKEFFAYLENNVDKLTALDPSVYAYVVQRSCELKADVVLADEQDLSGRRAVLNYGHTFGHALEMLGGYSGLTHGEGVAIGMMMAAELMAARDVCFIELVKRQEALWNALGLPVRASGFDPAEVLKAMSTDKKYEQGRSRLILPTELGNCSLVKDVPDEDVLEAIKSRCDA